MGYMLNNTSAQDLDSTIRCANSNSRPFEIERLQASLDNERKSTGARAGRLLDGMTHDGYPGESK